MAFVHTLVRTDAHGKKGWCAPIELGEGAPHYLSFVLPLDDSRDFFSKYVCEVITTNKRGKRREGHELVRHSQGSFVLHVADQEVWFAVSPAARENRRAPYVGSLKHEDFRRLFTEIEPVERGVLDRLYEDRGAIVIGCDPFAHYAGAKPLATENGAPRNAS